MISDYVNFDAEKYVRDYYKARESITELERQLDAMEYISAVATDRDAVQTSRGTSQTEGLALRRMALEERIAGYREHVETCQAAFKSLRQDEMMVIEQFFTAPTKTAATVRLEEVGISRAVAYRIRNRALKTIAAAVSGIENIGSGY